jgi:hypothetical protein
VMQRYLRPDLLLEAGIQDFDTWAGTFGDLVTAMEISPDATTWRQKTRFARFRNVPELLRMWHVAGDVKTAEDLNLQVPDLAPRADGRRLPETVVVEPSDEVTAYVKTTGPSGSSNAPSSHPKTTCSRSPATAAPRPLTCAWSKTGRHRTTRSNCSARSRTPAK